jgi:Leucine-rich repeat (LRR) protein
MANTHIDDAGFGVLMHAASQPGVLASLRKLDLSGNGISMLPGFATARLPSLRVLNLERNRITDAALATFSSDVSTLGQLKTLRRLGLRDNSYRNSGLAALVGAISLGAMAKLRQLSAIVRNSDPGFDECTPATIGALKTAMRVRRMFPLQRGKLGRTEPSVRDCDDVNDGLSSPPDSVYTSEEDGPSSHLNSHPRRLPDSNPRNLQVRAARKRAPATGGVADSYKMAWGEITSDSD